MTDAVPIPLSGHRACAWAIHFSRIAYVLSPLADLCCFEAALLGEVLATIMTIAKASVVVLWTLRTRWMVTMSSTVCVDRGRHAVPRPKFGT